MQPTSSQERRVVIIGAGPAGLTAAYELSKQNVPAVILEADSTVGGISRTVHYKGYLVDIGGHRFFTKWDKVNEIWQEVLGDKFLRRKTAFPHLLPEEIFLLSVTAQERSIRTRVCREYPHCPELPEVAARSLTTTSRTWSSG